MLIIYTKVLVINILKYFLLVTNRRSPSPRVCRSSSHDPVGSYLTGQWPRDITSSTFFPLSNSGTSNKSTQASRVFRRPAEKTNYFLCLQLFSEFFPIHVKMMCNAHCAYIRTVAKQHEIIKFSTNKNNHNWLKVAHDILIHNPKESSLI